MLDHGTTSAAGVLLECMYFMNNYSMFNAASTACIPEVRQFAKTSSLMNVAYFVRKVLSPSV